MATNHQEPIAAERMAVGDTMPVVRTTGGFTRTEHRAMRITREQAEAIYAVGGAVFIADTEYGLCPEMWRVNPENARRAMLFVLVEPD